MSSIAERLLLLRGAIKQGEFSRIVGVNPNTLRSYENGRSIPNHEFLEQICVQFSVSADWLLLGHGPMRLDNQADQTDYPVQADQTDCAAPMSPEPLTPDGDKAYTFYRMLERRLDALEAERRELSDEMRQLYRSYATLLQENGELKATLARLEERKG